MGLLTLGTAGLIGLTVFAIVNDVRMQIPAQAAAEEPAPQEPAGPIQRMDVPGLYAVNCQACHGVDGSGDAVRATMKTIPDFTSLEWQTAHPEVEIAHRIMDGRPAAHAGLQGQAHSAAEPGPRHLRPRLLRRTRQGDPGAAGTRAAAGPDAARCRPNRCTAISDAWGATTGTAAAARCAWPCRKFPTSPTRNGNPSTRTPSWRRRSWTGRASSCRR